MGIILIFRFILVTGIIVSILSGVASFIFMETLPPVLLGYVTQLESEEVATGEVQLILLLLALLIVTTVAIIGVWKFKPWARTLYVVMIFISFPMYILIGPVVMNVWEAMLSDTGFILEGVLIAMMYTGPISDMFHHDYVEAEVKVFS